MKTPVLAREKGRINDLHVQSNGDSAGQRPFGGQINGVEQGLQDSEITNQAGIQQAQIKAANEEHYGSEMDVDQGLGSGPPDFARTREGNVPVDDGDYADIEPLAIDLTGDDGQRACDHR